jgi:hypothetical protein
MKPETSEFLDKAREDRQARSDIGAEVRKTVQTAERFVDRIAALLKR